MATQEQHDMFAQMHGAKGNSSGRKSSDRPQQPAPEDHSALAAFNQTAAGTIRSAVGAVGQFADQLEGQRSLVTDHSAERIAAILDPHSIQAEIAVKTLEKLEGKAFIPFEVEAIELPELRPYVPQLPRSYASESSPASILIAAQPAEPNETTGNGKPKTAAGRGFAPQVSN